MLPTYSEALVTYLFSALLVCTGVFGLTHKKFYYTHIFHPYVVYRGKRLWTLFSACLVHVSWTHLLANTAFCLIFTSEVEYMLVDDFGRTVGRLLTGVTLVGIVVSCNLIDLLRFRNRLEVTTAGLSAFNCGMVIFYYSYFPVDTSEYSASLFPLTVAYQLAAAALLALAVACFLKLGRNPAAHLFGGLAGLGAAVMIRPQLVSEVIQHIQQ